MLKLPISTHKHHFFCPKACIYYQKKLSLHYLCNKTFLAKNNKMDYNMIGTAWSLLPPIVAIALALKTKEVYSSLFIGIILGAVQYCISMEIGRAHV